MNFGNTCCSLLWTQQVLNYRFESFYDQNALLKAVGINQKIVQTMTILIININCTDIHSLVVSRIIELEFEKYYLSKA